MPNTRHNFFEDRLCVSRIDENYDETYRPEGLIFKTSQIPNFCVPFDLMWLTNGQTQTSDDFNSYKISGGDSFIFKSYKEMIAKYPTPMEAHEALRSFRNINSLETPDKIKRYNECCFLFNVLIEPVALIGDEKIYTDFGLPIYSGMEEFRRSIF